MVLPIDEAILRRERRPVRRQVLQPRLMRRAPVRPVAEDEPARRQELQDVVPRLEDLALEGLPTPNDIADPLVRLARDAHGHELTGAIEPRPVGRVPFVVRPEIGRASCRERV